MVTQNLISPSAYFIKTKIASCPMKQELLARIQKEYQIYEYFGRILPKYIMDNHWDKLFTLERHNDRLNYIKSLGLVQKKEENNILKKEVKKLNLQNDLMREREVFAKGGMGYGPSMYQLYKPPFRNERNLHIYNSGKIASSLNVKDMPTIVFDLQFMGQPTRIKASQHMTAVQLSSSLNFNPTLPRSFPMEIVNADSNNPYIKRFLDMASHNNDFFKDYEAQLKRPFSICYPDIHKDNPYQYSNSSTESTDPSKKVIYISNYARQMIDGPLIAGTYILPVTFDNERQSANIHRTGNFDVMRLPIDKYFIWKCGRKAVPLQNIVAILSDVASGATWKDAMYRHISKRHFTEVEEKPLHLQYHYSKRNERRAEMVKISEMVHETFNGRKASENKKIDFEEIARKARSLERF